MGHHQVSEWMNRSFVAVPHDASLFDACAVMTRESVNASHALRVKRGDLAGVLSSFDVVRFLAQQS